MKHLILLFLFLSALTLSAERSSTRCGAGRALVSRRGCVSRLWTGRTTAMPYLKHDTKGEGVLNVTLGTHSFLKIKIEKSTPADGQEES